MRKRWTLGGLVTAGLVLGVTAPALASVNLLGDSGFEKPVVSGMVVKPVGGTLGACTTAPPYPGPVRCWQVTFATVAVVHDNFMSGGVAWRPREGKQLLWLSPTPPAANQGGTVSQAVPVQPEMKYIFHAWFGAGPDTAPGTRAKLLVTLKMCNPSGSTCPNVFTKIVTASSTGNPAAIGWKRLTLEGFTNADETLAELTLQSYPTGAAASAATLVDDTSLRSTT